MKVHLSHASVALPLVGLRRRFAILLVLLTVIPIFRSHAEPGDLDPDFGTGGKVTTDFHGFYDYIDSFVLDSSDRIVAAGGAKTNDGDGSFNFALARYSAAGVLDTSFGSGGKVTTDFSGGADQGFSVALDGSGRIVVSGLTYGANASLAVARYTAAGVLDTSFASGGKFVTDLSASADIGNAVAIDGSGRIVVGGLAGGDFVLVRLTSTGALDTSFGGGGVVSTDFGGSDLGVELEIDGSGRILLAGVAGGSNFALARYTSAGVLDSSFGSGGKVTTDFGGTDYGWTLAFDNDGKIIVAGWSDEDFAMARYSASGVLDTSFGNGGKTTTDFHGSLDECWSVVVDANDNIVLAGVAQTGASESSSNFALARYTSSGSLDATFGNGGKVTTNFNGGADHISCLGLDDAGNLIAAGRAFISGSDSDFAVARYFNLGEPEIALRLDSTNIPGGGSYNFATTNLGEEWTAIVTISNDGAVPLTGIAAAITPAGNSDFVVGTPAPATSVPAGESRTFTLIFAPQALGNRTGTLQVTSNAAPSPYIIHLSGTGIDTIDPVIAPQAADLTIVDGAAGNASAISDWLAGHGGAAATDNSGAVTWTHNYTAPPVPGHSVTITFTARDASNNSATTAAELVVLDQTPPQITSPAAGLTVNCSAPDKTAMVDAWLAASGTAAATDNSGSFTWSHNYTGVLPPACGTLNVTFTAGDPSGNESTTSAVLTVVDTTAPVISVPAVSTTVESNGTGNATQRNAWLGSHGGAAATDDCSGVSWSHNFTSLTHTLPQTVPVIFTVIDSCGNNSATTADFIIQDTTPPQITTQATDYYGDQDQATADVADFLSTRSGAQATDIAGPITWSHNYNGTPPPVGGYVTVTFTATDIVGLTASTSCRLFLFPPGAVWIGPTTGSWSVASNWRIPNGVIPDSSRDAYVDLFDFQNTRSIANGTFGVKNLYIGIGDQLDLAGSLTIHGNLISNAGLIRSRIEGDTSGATRSLVINGQPTLQGPGRLLLAGADRNQIVPGTVAPQELTVAAGHEISTTADTAGGYQGTSIHARLVNHGTLTADGGGLNLYSQPKVNDGVFRAINGGYLEIQPPVDNTGGTVIAGEASTVVLQNTLTGGTVTGPGTLLINSPAGLTGPMLLDSSLTTKLQRWATTLTGTITNNGVMQFGLPADTSIPYFHINGPVTVEGSGKIIFQGAGRRQILRANNAATDVLTIGAQQEITTDHLTDSNYQSSSIHAGLVNYGTVTADGGQLSLYSQPKTNHNLMRAINGGFLNMQADVDNTNATLFAGPGSILYPQAAITGGTITGTGTLLVNAGANLVGPMLLDSGLTAAFDAGSSGLAGIITHNADMTFGSATSTATSSLYINGPVSLEGSGKIVFQGVGRRQILLNNGIPDGVLTIGSGIEITTDANTGLNYQSSALHAPMVNNGTITANGGLTIYNHPKTNNGTMRAINGGYMDFLSVTVTNYNGTTDTLTGGKWEVISNGPVTTMDFTSMPVVNLAAGTTVRLSGANASLAQLSTLRNISGTLALENGKTLATTGNMIVPGTLQYGLPAAIDTTRLAVTGNVDFTGGTINVLDLGMTTGTYLLATWTGSITGAPVIGTRPPAMEHTLVLDATAKTLTLQVIVHAPVVVTSFQIAPGTGPEAGRNLVTIAGTGHPGVEYVLEASEELQIWGPISTALCDPSGILSLQFTQSPEFSRRFYRFRFP